MAILIEIPQSFFYNGKQKIEKKPIKQSAWIVVQCAGTLVLHGPFLTLH